MKTNTENKIKKSKEKAENAVDLVKIRLEKLGFSVSKRKSVSSNGHDLFAIKNNELLTVEVKAAYYNSRSWKVGRVGKTKSDVIAIVFPNGEVNFETMQSHLAQSPNAGSRSLTLLGFVYE